MATFASVTDGLVVDMFEVADAVIEVDGALVESIGQQFLTGLFGAADYVLTGMDGFRGCYPGVGYTWDGTVFAPSVIVKPEPEVSP
jgi:hypothetical protein